MIILVCFYFTYIFIKYYKYYKLLLYTAPYTIVVFCEQLVINLYKSKCISVHEINTIFKD